MLSRREVLRGSVAFGGLVVLGCKGKQPAPICTDSSGLSSEDAAARTTLQYVDHATDDARACKRCTQFLEAQSDGACGSCRVIKGPISPAGSCKLFASKG